MKNSDQALTNALRQALGAAKPQPRTSTAIAYSAQKEAAKKQAASKRKR